MFNAASFDVLVKDTAQCPAEGHIWTPSQCRLHIPLHHSHTLRLLNPLNTERAQKHRDFMFYYN